MFFRLIACSLCKDADDHGVALLTAPTIRAMDCLASASLSDEDLGSEHEENGVDDNDEDGSISVQLVTQNSNDDKSDDDEQQVFM
jgi:hypothetical protein